MRILINGKLYDWSGATIKYENICNLIGQEFPTITWRSVDGEHGGLREGQSMPIEESMMFTAINQGRA